MLSNPTTIHQRQRQHRRQQSTPSAFDAPKVAHLPLQQHGVHRRGMSLDQRQRRQSPQQDLSVSITNTGLQQHKQHVLREAQQQRSARPGSQYPQQSPYLNYSDDENYLISPLVSPQRQDFDSGCLNSYNGMRATTPSYPAYPGQFNSTMRVNSNESNSFDVLDTSFLNGNGNLAPSSYLDFSAGFPELSEQQDWSSTVKAKSRPSSERRISGGIAGRVAQFESMSTQQQASRPMTPPNQNASNLFPITPATTPFHRTRKVQADPRDFTDNRDTSMEETIKPIRAGNQRTKNTFQQMREQVESNQPPSPPNTAPMPSLASFDTAKMPTAGKFTSMPDLYGCSIKTEEGFDSSYYSRSTSGPSSQMSQPSTPEMSHSRLLRDPYDNKPYFESANKSPYGQSIGGDYSPEPSMRGQTISRSQSVDSFNLEETITDTGITIDDIANYIEGPDPVDQKWLCLYPECNKRFGRKENIKSHVQTHLGDRQYQCPHCQKCFVRQHDLKRHAKIHSGVKPYPCLCGNSFARHDALTRHRQRGMCIGAFEGVVKKVVKRGRPRKNRPETDERLDKSSRTRTRNKSKAMSLSSASEYSESSYGQSPPAHHDAFDERVFADFSDDYSQNTPMTNYNNYRYQSANSPVPPDYVVPQIIQSAPSPSGMSSVSHQSHRSHRSHYSHHSAHSYQRGSVASIPEYQLPSNPATPARSEVSLSHSQYNTPPELCPASSPPTSNASHGFYDVSEQSDSLDLGKLADMQMDLAVQDSMFLDNFGSGNNFGQLEQDPDVLLLNTKFDDAFSGAVDDQGLGLNMDMFNGVVNDDVFFGSP